MNFIRLMSLVGVSLLMFNSCASVYEAFQPKELENKEFNKVVQVETIDEPEDKNIDIPKKNINIKSQKNNSIRKKTISKKNNLKKNSKLNAKKSSVVAPEKNEKIKQLGETSSKVSDSLAHFPKLEDGTGFSGRRPLIDPFRVGEEITWSVSYFKVEAGKFKMGVKSFKKVNGAKSYHFHYAVKSSSLFSLFYAVDDVAETYVNYDDWTPSTYAIHVKQSKQVRETRTFFDWSKGYATMWDKKKRPDKPLEEKKIEWKILPFSQNVFSVAFYLRTFTLAVGKTYRVRVAHEGKNLVMSAKVLKKVNLDTPLGRFPSFVIRPTFEVDGLFKPTGDNLLWVTADERKFILRFESKIKIGTIVAMVESLKK